MRTAPHHRNRYRTLFLIAVKIHMPLSPFVGANSDIHLEALNKKELAFISKIIDSHFHADDRIISDRSGGKWPPHSSASKCMRHTRAIGFPLAKCIYNNITAQRVLTVNRRSPAPDGWTPACNGCCNGPSDLDAHSISLSLSLWL